LWVRRGGEKAKWSMPEVRRGRRRLSSEVFIEKKKKKKTRFRA